MNLTKKQQLQVSLIVVFVIILCWQLYKLFSSPATGLPAVPPTAIKAATPSAVSPALNLPAMKASIAEPVKSAMAMPALEASEMEYTRLSSELQLIQMQRAIAESYEAIAVSRRNTARAVAETAQIAAGTPVSMPGAMSMESAPVNNEYELIYTGQEGHQWTATLKKNNQTFDVVPGTVIGNMKVVSIDNNGVIIRQGDIRKIITFNGTAPVTDAIDVVHAVENSSNPLSVQSHVAANPALLKGNTPVVLVNKSLPAEALSATLNRPAMDVPPVKAFQPTDQSLVTRPAIVPVPSASAARPLPSVVISNKPETDKNNRQKRLTVTTAGSKSTANVHDLPLMLNPEHYTIQLMSDNNTVSMSHFIKKHRLSDKAIMARIKGRGENCYVLVYGDYPDASSANSALVVFDDSLLEWNPFVRKIGQLQATSINVK